MVKGEERLFAAVAFIDGSLQVFFLKYMGNDEYGMRMHGRITDLGIKETAGEIPDMEIVDDENTYRIVRVDNANHLVWLELKGL